MVALHHGTVTVESEEGKGTAFKVEFPIQRSAYSEEEIDETSVTVSTLDEVISTQREAVILETASEENISGKDNMPEKKHTLLLVEDNEDLFGIDGEIARC